MSTSLKKVFKNHAGILGILFLAAVIFFFRLGRDPLYDWDECIYAEYAREMKQNNAYLTNLWNGVRVLEKSPFYSLTLQIPYLFSVNEFSARSVSVIMGLFLLGMVYFYCQNYISRSSALIAPLILLSSHMLTIYIFRVNTDIGFTAFLLVGFIFFVLSQKSPKFSYFSGLFFAIATLQKGLSSIFFILPIFLYTFLRKRPGAYGNFLRLVGAFLIVIAPWHIVETFLYGKEFLNEYFFEHLVTRYIYNIYPSKGSFFYLTTIGSDLGIWIIVGAVSLFLLFFRRKSLVTKKNYQQILLLTLFTVIPLILFSSSKTKIMWYVLPLYPYISILLALSLDTVCNVFSRIPLRPILLIAAGSSSIYTVINTTEFFRNQRNITPSYTAFAYIHQMKGTTLHYLVEEWYRNIKQNPGVPKTIPAEFFYGQHPCVTYYSQKKVIFYYSTDEFFNHIKDSDELHLANKSDFQLLDIQNIKIEYENSDYFLFHGQKQKSTG